MPNIPPNVVLVAGKAIGDSFHSHNKINQTFIEAGAPGDPPEGNCVEKCQAWLKRLNGDESIDDPLSVLQELLLPLFTSELDQDKDRILLVSDALRRNELEFDKVGQVIPIATSVSETRESTGNILIFLSHSSQDQALAKAIVDLVQRALAIKSQDIRCTSVPGYKLEIGSDANNQLKRECIDSGVLVGLITELSVESAYVLFELGARWGSGKFMAPLLGAGATPKILKSPLNGLNALTCDESDLHQFVVEIGQRLNRPLEQPQVYLQEIQKVVEASNRLKNERNSRSRIDDSSLANKPDFMPRSNDRIQISIEASWLLMQAAIDEHARIAVLEDRSGLQVNARKTEFVKSRDSRSASIWLDAMTELESRNLIEPTDQKRQVYRVCQLGFKFADQLWCVFVLKEIDRLEKLGGGFVSESDLAEATGLDTGDSPACLQQYLNSLSRRDFIEAVSREGGIAAGRLTHMGRGHIRQYLDVNFSEFRFNGPS